MIAGFIGVCVCPIYHIGLSPQRQPRSGSYERATQPTATIYDRAVKETVQEEGEIFTFYFNYP